MPAPRTQRGRPDPSFDVLTAKSKKYGVPLWVLEGVYGIETAWGSNSTTSSAGAMGPFQFIPSTARAYNYPLTNTPNEQQFDQQADAQARYLRDLIHGHGGNIDAALRAYSGGGYGEAEVKSKAGSHLTSSSLNSDGSAKSFVDQAGDKASGAVNSAGDALAAIGQFLGLLVKPATWLHVLEVVGGAILLVMGLRALSGASNDPVKLAGAAAKVAA